MGMTAERENMDSKNMFSLSRSDYKNVLSSTISDLLTDNEFTDVTLVSHDDEQIKAHKVILCSASAFFRRIIVNNPHRHPLIYLKNVDMKILKSVIDFIYLGQAAVESNMLEHFLSIAKELEIQGLSEEMQVLIENEREIKSQYAKNESNDKSQCDELMTLKDESETKILDEP